jgi:hypothetical protein
MLPTKRRDRPPCEVFAVVENDVELEAASEGCARFCPPVAVEACDALTDVTSVVGFSVGLVAAVTLETETDDTQSRIHQVNTYEEVTGSD